MSDEATTAHQTVVQPAGVEPARAQSTDVQPAEPQPAGEPSGAQEVPAAGPANAQWFVVHTYSGFENKVAQSIEQRAKIFGLEHKIGRVIVPTEEVVEIRKGEKRITPQKFFPGYVLVEMDLSDETWHLVRSTPKVTGFVGSGTKPVPLSDEEVQEILRQMEVGAEKPKPKAVFQKGDKIRVIEGPFVNFTGTIEEVNLERGKVKVMVAIFGRLTPVELEYYQVERL